VPHFARGAERTLALRRASSTRQQARKSITLVNTCVAASRRVVLVDWVGASWSSESHCLARRAEGAWRLEYSQHYDLQTTIINQSVNQRSFIQPSQWPDDLSLPTLRTNSLTLDVFHTLVTSVNDFKILVWTKSKWSRKPKLNKCLEVSRRKCRWNW